MHDVEIDKCLIVKFYVDMMFKCAAGLRFTNALYDF